MKKEVDGLYLYLQKRLLECCNGNNHILRRTADEKLLQVHIPRILLPIIFKRLEEFQLINKLTRDEFELINTNDSKLIESPSKLYHKVGLF